MNYEIVTLKETIVAGVSARTSNLAPDMSQVISRLWERFYKEGIYGMIPDKLNKKALGIYTDYAGDEQSEYTAMVGCEVVREPETGNFVVYRVPAGRYARFIIHGDMVEAVARAWQEILKMNLPRSFVCDFEEYQDDRTDDAEIHIYIGLKDE